MLIRSSESCVGYWVSVGTENELCSPEALEMGTPLTTREARQYTTVLVPAECSAGARGTEEGGWMHRILIRPNARRSKPMS
jgi:hypothetical protein